MTADPEALNAGRALHSDGEPYARHQVTLPAAAKAAGQSRHAVPETPTCWGFRDISENTALLDLVQAHAGNWGVRQTATVKAAWIGAPFPVTTHGRRWGSRGGDRGVYGSRFQAMNRDACGTAAGSLRAPGYCGGREKP